MGPPRGAPSRASSAALLLLLLAASATDAQVVVDTSARFIQLQSGGLPPRRSGVSVGNATHLAFIGGLSDTTAPSATQTIYNVATNTFTTAPTEPLVLRGAAVASVGRFDTDLGIPVNDNRAWAIGGVSSSTGAEVNTVAFYSGSSWSALATTGTAPPVRKNAVAAYVPDCADGLNATNLPCVFLFGGDVNGAPRSDTWFLWVSETPARWQQVTSSGAPPALTGSSISVSSDGETVYIFGGLGTTGPTNEVFAFSLRGFADFTTAEATNLAVGRTSWQSSTDPTWGWAGPGRGNDGNTQQSHDNGPPSRACTHTLQEDNPWWKVDLGATRRVDRIVFWPRNDCCTDRHRDYQMWFGPSNVTMTANTRVPPPWPAIGGNVVTLQPARPMFGRFFWYFVPGTLRFVSVCELQLFQRRPYIWRRITGTQNLARNKEAAQSSIWTGGSGGHASFAVDGLATNTFSASPPTCTHTENTGVARIPWLRIDLGREYDVSQLVFWPRTDCCLERSRGLGFTVGYSMDFSFNTLCPNIPFDFGSGAGSRTISCPLRGRYVHVTRFPQAGQTENILTICELVVNGRLLLDEPSPRWGMSYTTFRGNLVIYGGNAADGFRVADAFRMFDMSARQWIAAATPLGTIPAPRALTHFLPLPPATAGGSANDVLIYAGQSNSDSLTDASILRFATCAPFSTDGFARVNCTQSGTVCVYSCIPGFTDRNQGSPLICRDDGSWDGIVPPCNANPPGVPLGPVGANPATELGVALSAPFTNATVSYRPGTLGYYFQTGITQFNVFAIPANEYYEQFDKDTFDDPSAWARFVEFPQISNNHYFANRRLWLDAAAGADTWLPSINFNGFNAHNVPSAPNGPWTVTGNPLYRGLILHRAFPATIDPSAPWVFETYVEAGTLPVNSQVGIAVFDPLACPIPRTSTLFPAQCAGHPQMFTGLRRNADAFYPFVDAIGSGIIQNISPEPAPSPNVYLRIEYSPTGSPNTMGYQWRTSGGVLTNANQRFLFYYKFRANDAWIRHPFFLDNSMMYNGTFFIPPNFRPALMMKQWNTAVSIRSVAAYRYVRIGLPTCANPGCQRTVPGTNLTAAITGLTPGGTYRFAARAATQAGYGPAAVTSLTYSLPAPAPPALPALINAATNKPAWLSSTLGGDMTNNGAWRAVDGNFATYCFSGFGANGCERGSVFSVDLQVEYAAVKAIHIFHRTDAFRERLLQFTIHAGQDPFNPRNNFGVYAQDLDPSRFQSSYVNSLWSKGIGDMDNGVFSVGAANARFNFSANGRYVHIVNSPFHCTHLHLQEVQVFVPNACPARSSVGAAAVTGGGRNCNANAPFGAICEQACLPGYVQVSGSTTATCNGEEWNTEPLVCQPACGELDPPAYAALSQHELIWLDFDTPLTREMTLAMDTIEPFVAPLANNFAVADGVLNAFSRIGCNSDPSLVFWLEKIRSIDGNGVFVFSADVSTADRVGLLFRVVDARNYYAAYLDVQLQMVVIQKFLNAVPTVISSAPVTLLADTRYSFAVSVEGPSMNVTLNNRVILRTADSQLTSGYAGLFAGSTAIFDNVRFLRTVASCRGATNGERCFFTCASGLIQRGPGSRTCRQSGTTANWSPAVPAPGSPSTHPDNLLCTLDPPIFPDASLSVAENSGRGSNVGFPLMAASTSSLYPVQYLITRQFPADPFVGGAASFTVDFCSGQVKVAQPLALNFEWRSTFLLEVRAFIFGFDGAETYRNITVSVLDVDEPPVLLDTTVFLPEDSPTGTPLGPINWWDPENSTVAWTLDVDGGQGRFALNATNGTLLVASLPSNSSGFSSMSTGSGAPLNFELLGAAPFDLVLVAQQLAVGSGTVGNPLLSSLRASGKLRVQLTDRNDPPVIVNSVPLRILEAAATAVPFVVGDLSILDEDAGLFNSSVTYSLIAPGSYPVDCPLLPGTILPHSSSMFSLGPLVGLTGSTVTLAERPGFAPLAATTEWKDLPAVAFGDDLTRAVYTLCVRATDGFGGVTTAPVRVSVIANVVDQPVIFNVSLNSYATEGGEDVVFFGKNFQPAGSVAPPRAWYTSSSDGRSYNATGCTVLADFALRCRTVAGVGEDFTWTIWWDERRAVLFQSPVVAAYRAPVITDVSGNTNIPTEGGTVVVFRGLNFGPPNTTVAVRYGANGLEFACSQLLNASDSYTVVRCSASAGMGENLPWTLTVGGQVFASTVSTGSFAYARPVITAIDVGNTTAYTVSTLDTAGGQDFRVMGSNFGPPGFLSDPRYGVTVSYGGDSGTLLVATNCRAGSVSPFASTHTLLTCRTVPGVGLGHKVFVVAGGVAAAAPFPSVNQTGPGTAPLTYLAPRVTAVYGEGSRNGETAGGMVLTIEGRHFGPITFPVATINSVTYGRPPSDLGRYTAAQCRVTQEPPLASIITCVTAEGVGAGHSLVVMVGAQSSAPFANAVSYAPPQVAFFTGPGAADARTVGGDTVFVSGKNFGPADAYTGALLSVSYGVKLDVPVRGVIPAVNYRAANCRVSTPHVQLACETAEGAGGNLAWRVVVDSQVSSQPTTNYAPPRIDAIQYQGVPGAPVTDANVNGGQVLELVGRFFGPVAYDNTSLPLVQTVSYGLSGTEYALLPSHWTLVSHTLLRVTLLPGTGQDLRFLVTIADQRSTSADAARFSFALPFIVGLLPPRGPTGSTKEKPFIVTARAMNLPLRDPFTRVSMTFGNTNPVPLTPDIPSGAASILRATNPDGSVNISFALPYDGGGLEQAVRFHLGPVTSTVPAYSTPVTNASAFSFLDPVITSIVVTRARFLPEDADNVTASAAATSGGFITCPWGAAGWQPTATWYCGDPNLQRLEIIGRDFTSAVSAGQDGVTRLLEIMTFNYTALNIPGIGEVWDSTAEVSIYSWSHTLIVAFIRRRSGALRLTLTSPPFWSAENAGVQRLVTSFLDVSPEISKLQGAASYPTVGGTLADAIELWVENIATADTIRVLVDGRNATVVNPLTGLPFASDADIKTYIQDRSNLALNPSFAGIWVFKAVVPPGQGRGVIVQVFRVRGSAQDGSNTGFVINYRAPTLTSYALLDPVVSASWGSTLPVTGITRIIVPTNGSARLRIFGANLGFDPAVVIGDGFRLTAPADVVPCPGTAGLHTCYEFPAPEGEGTGTDYEQYPSGYFLLLEAGNQKSLPVTFLYKAPTATRVLPGSGSGFPTRGGVPVIVEGRDFGKTRRPVDVPIVVEFGRESESLWLECTAPQRLSHTQITCTLPEGSGFGLSVRIRVAEEDNRKVSTETSFSYDAPVVTAVTLVAGSATSEAGVVNASAGFAFPVLQGETTGGDVLTITGANFGVRDPALHCAFFTWAYRSSDATRGATWRCNDGEDWLGEGEIPADNVFSWDHETIVLYTPPGLGVKELQISVRGNLLAVGQGSVAARAQNRIFKYLPPVLDRMQVISDAPNPNALIDTEGGDKVALTGRGFGPDVVYTNATGELFVTKVPLAVAPSLPTAQLAIVFHRACVARARTFQGTRVPDAVVVPMPYGNDKLGDCSPEILSQADGELVFRSGPGIGRNRTLRAVVIDGGEFLTSPRSALTFDYRAPAVRYFNPNPTYLVGENTVIDIFGNQFGNLELADKQGWSQPERELTGTVGGIGCVTMDRRRGFDINNKPETIIMCEIDAALVPAGPRNTTLRVAGQSGEVPHTASISLLVGCGQGYYGRENETCVPCPAQNEDPAKEGAKCRGYIPGRTNVRAGVHTYPRPSRGWFNLNSSDTVTRANGETESMMGACPVGFQDNGRDVCIVPCDPPEACLGDNFCAYGYTSKAPLFRCAYCDKGFYKRAGECIKCPDSPAGLFIGFIVLVLFVCAAAFQLNKKQVNIAVVSIGIDFFQVLAIFSQSRIKWPPIIKELFHVLSAFNLNIEIVAPECLIPDVSYKQKFWFIMLLPLSVGALFGLNYVLILGYKVLVLGQDKRRWHSHSPALVSSCLVLIYMLYLYLTRTIFDVFNCTPTNPPDGNTYLQVVFERCNVAGGTHLTLLPYAVAGLIVYTGGYPAFIGYTLYKNRETVMEDQLLRAKGSGADVLTGPRTYKLRLTFGRSYFQFKPDSCLWILAIIIRKFFIALTAVVFNKNPSFQMAACLLIMFLAYALQVHVRPYMSPANFDEVLKAHVESSYTNAIHARLRANLANIETRGRKKVRKNLLNFEGKLDRSAVFGILSGWLFAYNTVEEIMLFAAVIVCLMGIMYQATEVSTYYPESKDSVTAVVLIVIIAAIVYFVTVLVTEMVILYNEDSRTKQMAKAASRGGARGKEGGKSAAGEGAGSGANKNRLVDDSGDINVGKLDTQMNPLFLTKGSGGAGGDGATASFGGVKDASDAILSQRTAPTQELWIVFQNEYREVREALERASSQLADAKKAAQKASVADADGDGGAAVGGGGGAAGPRKKAFGPTAAVGDGAASGGNALSTFKASARGPAMRSLRKVVGAADG